MEDFKIAVNNGKAAIYTPYNAEFVKRVKLLGGRWSAGNKCWTVDEAAIGDVRGVMREIYGRDDQLVGEIVDAELTFAEEVSEYHGPVTILGRTIATAFGRDSGARVGDGVLFLKGSPKSGGSVKNWRTVIPDGCVVKLLKLPKMILENAELPEGVELKILGDDIDRAALEEEKARLLKRIEEIDALLNT